MSLTLRNPHSIQAVLSMRPQDIYEIRPPSVMTDAWRRVVAEASGAGITITQPAMEGKRRKREERRDIDGGRGGGGEARVREKPGASLEDIFAEGPGLRIVLEQVQDPRNVGSIFRTSAFFGVTGMILTRDRSARLSDIVYDTASGGVEYVAFSVQTNLRRTLEEAKERGFWILGSSEHAEKGLSDVCADRRWLLVLGNEEQGLRRLTLDTCDDVCRISPRGSGVGSLNVSTAAAILISHLTP